MKEATGELSTTVIAIVAIAAILAVFTVFLLPMLKAQIALTQACNSGPGFVKANGDLTISCEDVSATAADHGNSWKCEITSGDGNGSSKQCHN